VLQSWLQINLGGFIAVYTRPGRYFSSSSLDVCAQGLQANAAYTWVSRTVCVGLVCAVPGVCVCVCTSHLIVLKGHRV
jgi:hypothetical protein